MLSQNRYRCRRYSLGSVAVTDDQSIQLHAPVLRFCALVIRMEKSNRRIGFHIEDTRRLEILYLQVFDRERKQQRTSIYTWEDNIKTGLKVISNKGIDLIRLT